MSICGPTSCGSTAATSRRRTAHGDPVVAHGYAFTGHVAQGLTVRESFVLATDELYREWAYTALSRARDANRLYVVGAEPRDPRRDRAVGATLARRRPARPHCVVAPAVDGARLGEPAPTRTCASALRAIAEERESIAARLDAHGAERRQRWWQRGRCGRRPDSASSSRQATS